MAGGEVGGRAPVFAHTQNHPDEGQEGGDLQPRGAAGGMNGKPMIFKTSLIPLMHTPVYASPLINNTPQLSWAYTRLTRPTRVRKLG